MGSEQLEKSQLVAISILNWNRWQDTLACLESVRQLDYPNYLTIVADNGSRNGSVEGIRASARATLSDQAALIEYTRAEATRGGDQAAEVCLDSTKSSVRTVLVVNEKNLGFAGGNNVSISYALARPRPADYVFLLNNDVLLEPDCLTQLVAVDRASDAGLVGAVLKPMSDLSLNERTFRGMGSQQADQRPDGGLRYAVPASRNAWTPVPWVAGGAVLARRDLLEAVKELHGFYLDERFFLYVEDVALSLTAQKLGYKTVRANHAVGYHVGAASSGGRGSAIEYYYETRNSIFLAFQRPAPQRLRFHATFPVETAARVAKNLACWRVRSARAVFRGFIDGYRGLMGKWEDHDREASA